MSVELLSVAEMAAADQAAMRLGVPGIDLMEQAGSAVADAVRLNYPHGPVLVLCGPGNNGGDGFVAARLLQAAGWPVQLVLLGSRAELIGDAAVHAGRWTGDVDAADAADFDAATVIIDALFGAGLSKPVAGEAARLIAAANDSGRPIVAVDLPSGLRGDDGQPLGEVIRADRTVTFFRLKPAHLLLPGRRLCGSVALADIGIPSRVLTEIAPRTWRNGPDLWRRLLPRPQLDAHKYARGHALIRAGAQPGAVQLAGHAALRVGAGLVTLAVPAAQALQALVPNALMTEEAEGHSGWVHALRDVRRNAVLLGPGAGVSDATAMAVLTALRRGSSTVLDADALTSFRYRPTALFEAISGPTLLTPHDGEFGRLFPDLAKLPGKLERARQAARRAGATILLKGADSVIAAPDGRAVINDNAPPDLATAGSGDVLAGICLGLLAQGMPVFEAGCAAVWLHGAAAQEIGSGLIADDLPPALRPVLRRLRT